MNDFIGKVFDDDDDVVERRPDFADVDRPLELVGDLSVDSRLEEGEHWEPEPHPVGVVGEVTQPEANVINPFVLTKRPNKLAFVPDKFYPPSLIFKSEGSSYTITIKH